MTQLSNTYNLKPIHEPHELKSIDELNDGNYDGVCVKLLTDFPTSDIIKIVEYSKNFDYVFLLNRQNVEEHFKSIYVMYEITKRMDVPWSWGDSYKKLSNYESKEKEYKTWIVNKTNSLNNISKLIDIEILYYEDLYYNTKVCDLQGLDFYPDNSKKLYSETHRKTII
jgi:hypothetical protein